MKKKIILGIALMLLMSSIVGCGNKAKDPGAPPAEVLQPENTINETTDSETVVQQKEVSTGEILENAVSVKIGLVNLTSYDVDMIDNAAANTMLGYLSESEMRFPTYTYEGEEGYVAQSIRGNYTRDDEITIENISAGDMYLFSGGQLRLYFKDIEGANITATPVGYYKDREAVKTAVPSAYEENRGDTWNVDVYFLIKKN